MHHAQQSLPYGLLPFTRYIAAPKIFQLVCSTNSFWQNFLTPNVKGMAWTLRFRGCAMEEWLLHRSVLQAPDCESLWHCLKLWSQYGARLRWRSGSSTAAVLLASPCRRSPESNNRETLRIAIHKFDFPIHKINPQSQNAVKTQYFDFVDWGSLN